MVMIVMVGAHGSVYVMVMIVMVVGAHGSVCM